MELKYCYTHLKILFFENYRPLKSSIGLKQVVFLFHFFLAFSLSFSLSLFLTHCVSPFLSLCLSFCLSAFLPISFFFFQITPPYSPRDSRESSPGPHLAQNDYQESARCRQPMEGLAFVFHQGTCQRCKQLYPNAFLAIRPYVAPPDE